MADDDMSELMSRANSLIDQFAMRRKENEDKKKEQEKDLDKKINRIPVESSDVASIGYGEKKMILEVEFHSGSIYQYLNVPEAVYKSFMSSNSKGKFINSDIKGKFSYNLIKK